MQMRAPPAGGGVLLPSSTVTLPRISLLRSSGHGIGASSRASLVAVGAAASAPCGGAAFVASSLQATTATTADAKANEMVMALRIMIDLWRLRPLSFEEEPVERDGRAAPRNVISRELDAVVSDGK